MTLLHQCLGDRYEPEAIEYFNLDADVFELFDGLSDEDIEQRIAECENHWDDYEDYLSEYYSELAERYESE